MKYYSDITKKLYDTPEALKKDEQVFTEAEAEKKAAEVKKTVERSARAKAVEAAYRTAVEAYNKYIKMRNNFVETYGSFHMTYATTSDENDEVAPQSMYSLFDMLFDLK